MLDDDRGPVAMVLLKNYTIRDEGIDETTKPVLLSSAVTPRGAARAGLRQVERIWEAHEARLQIRDGGRRH